MPAATPVLRIEHGEPFVGTAAPRLSWQIEGASDGWQQTGYQVSLLEQGGHTSFTAESSDSVLVPWPFRSLQSRDRVRVAVRATGSDGAPTDWSDPVEVEVALLDPADWVARAVAPDRPEDQEGGQPPALLRKDFAVGSGLARARLYVTAHGLYAASISGQRVGDELFAPGWSAYRSRLRYQVHDVTAVLDAGQHALGVVLADGWYRGYLLPTVTRRNWYGTRVAALAQLELTYDDGHREVVATDETWRAGTGPLRSADIYRGESYDGRWEAVVEGWDRPGFDDSGWVGCTAVERDPASLVRQDSPPVRRTEVVQPVEVITSPSGRTIVDFGQNLVGHVRLHRTPAEPGAEVVLRHAEVLQDGELCTEPLRAATATDLLTVGEGGRPDWAPEFTFHGFRYSEVTGLDVSLADLSAEVVHSDLRRTGWFTCSDPLVTRMHENAVWSMRGNFLDVPTDCPQRDERLGWTGDLQVFAPSASFLYDAHGLLVDWLADLAADQDPSGGVPYIVPNPMGSLYNGGTAAAWSDAAVIVPWVVHQRFGDRDVLRRQWPSMVAFTECLLSEHGPELNPELFQFGDWVDPRAPFDAPGDGPTDKLLVAAAYLVHTLDLMAATARLLGEVGPEGRYLERAEHYRALWRERFVLPDGRLSSDTETAYALAVCFRLLSSAERERAGERLAVLLAAGSDRIATGFVGTPLVCDALTTTGQLDAAYRLLLQTEPPSFLYPVTQGATTIWERWDSLLPDGRVNPGEMTSFNHYALGAVVDWLHRCVGGLAPLSPGYREVLVRPLPGGGLTWADVRHTSRYGDVAVAWQLDDGVFTCRLEVPAGTRARVVLPVEGWEPVEVGSGQHAFSGRFAPPVPGEEPSAPWDVPRPTDAGTGSARL